MHPVLVELPIPRLSVALGPALALLTVLLLVVMVLGHRGKARDLYVIGLSGAVVSVLAAIRHRYDVIQVGPVPLYGYGVLVSLALVLGWVLTTRLARSAGLAHGAISACYFVTAGGGLLGARALYVLTNLRDFGSVRDALSLSSGGLVFYGGVLGGFVASLVFLRRRGVAWLAWADTAAPSLALGSVIGRIGCYMAGCDYGIPLGARAPRWLVRLGTFPRWPDEIAGAAAGSPAWVDHVLSRGLPLDSTASLPVHPTQIYESLAAGALLLGLLALGSRRRFRGEVFLAYVVGYGVLRFFIEMLRDDPERGSLGPLSTSQWIASASVVAALIAWRRGFVAPTQPAKVPGGAAPQ